MLEQSLGLPILQVAVGRFSNVSSDWALAVLHPQKMVVYSVVAVGDGSQTSVTQYLALTILYEHTFQRTASNLCFGPFGKPAQLSLQQVLVPDEICVQSMDGCLQFFKQEVASFARFLPDSLIPGPLVYAPALMSFITASSGLAVCCHRQQALAASTGEKVTSARHNGAGKRVRAAWEVNVGEHVLDIQVARWTGASLSQSTLEVDIIVLGQHTLFCITGTGEMRSQRRLDYVPACMCTFPVAFDCDGTPTHSVLVASASPSKVFVYSTSKLEWACGVPSNPVVMSVANFGDLMGLIICLDEFGVLSINYLGTDPPASVATTNDVQDLNYEEMDEEHRSLLGVIREATSDMKSEPADRVMLRCEIPTRLDCNSQTDEPENVEALARWETRAVTARLVISYT